MSPCIFKLIKISIPYNFLTIWIFFLQFSTFFKMKQYLLFPVISMHVEKQHSSPLYVISNYFSVAKWVKKPCHIQ